MEGQNDSDVTAAPASRQSSPISHFMEDNLKKLSRFDRFMYHYSNVVLSVNPAICGLMAHNIFRKTLKIRKRYLVSALPVAGLPAIINGIYHEILVTYPLMEGSLSCLVCTQLRSCYIGLSMGGVAPIILAAFVNLMMIPDVLRTAPAKGGLMREMVNFTKPVFSKLKYFLLFEAAFSTIVATKQHETIGKLLQMPLGAETPEAPENQTSA